MKKKIYISRINVVVAYLDDEGSLPDRVGVLHPHPGSLKEKIYIIINI